LTSYLLFLSLTVLFDVCCSNFLQFGWFCFFDLPISGPLSLFMYGSSGSCGRFPGRRSLPTVVVRGAVARTAALRLARRRSGWIAPHTFFA
jgi:hypothetical protein